jgi:hypothetical protein
MRLFNWLSMLTLFLAMFALEQTRIVVAEDSKSPPSMTFSGQMSAICAELLELSDKEPKLKNQKIMLANVVAANLTDSNFSLRVEEELKSKLAAILAPKSELILSGELDYLESSSSDNSGFKVIQVTIKVVNAKRIELAKIFREVNDTGDIARILQLTIAPPDTPDFSKRNAETAKAEKAPAFALAPGSKTQVTAMNFPRYAMELRRHENGTGAAMAVQPNSENGLAFAPIGIGDTYEVVLYNYDEESDAVAKIEIDGLDVVNTFNSDKTSTGEKQSYPGYFIPRAVQGKPGQHVISGWLNTVKPSKDNVFKFVVNKLGEGAASQLNVRSTKTGFVTATFFDACEPNGKLRGRNFGETGKGEGMRVDYELKPVQVAKVPLSIVSIRYSRSPTK